MQVVDQHRLAELVDDFIMLTLPWKQIPWMLGVDCVIVDKPSGVADQASNGIMNRDRDAIFHHPPRAEPQPEVLDRLRCAFPIYKVWMIAIEILELDVDRLV